MQMGNPLPFKSEDLPRLTAGWNLEFGFAAQGGHLYLSAQSSLDNVDWQVVEDVIIVSGEEFMLLD